MGRKPHRDSIVDEHRVFNLKTTDELLPKRATFSRGSNTKPPHPSTLLKAQRFFRVTPTPEPSIKRKLVSN